MKEGCNCCCHKKCEVCSSESHVCEEKHHEYFEYFLEIADEAWEEVLKEKIKEHILSTRGEKMEELAKIVSESNSERWKSKMQKKKGCHAFKERLSQFFGGGSWA